MLNTVKPEISAADEQVYKTSRALTMLWILFDPLPMAKLEELATLDSQF